MTVCFIVVVIGFFVVWLMASGRSNKDDEVLVNANMDIRVHEVNVDGLTAKQFEVQKRSFRNAPKSGPTIRKNWTLKTLR